MSFTPPRGRRPENNPMTPIIAKPSRDRREESGSIMLYALFAVILLSSLAFLTTTLTPNTTSAALDLKKYIESLNTEVGELPDEEPPEIVVDYGSVIDAGFIQAAEAAGMNPIDYILAYWQWSDPWYILDSDGNKHYFLIDNPKDVAGGVVWDYPGQRVLFNLKVRPMDGTDRLLDFVLVYPWRG